MQEYYLLWCNWYSGLCNRYNQIEMDSNESVKEFDIYRDSKLRYCGYANEIGESFRPLIPKIFVHLSYAVAVCYVLAECGDKSRKIYNVRHIHFFVLNEICELVIHPISDFQKF